ncbi:hypothetical protein, partial [Stutzerimonas nitrititolerans]|uniref:hypothetical protein n=1 Tax=Stutzerimonas nitrititolerans TaxID=2482751 RepID=UPI0028A9BFB5
TAGTLRASRTAGHYTEAWGLEPGDHAMVNASVKALEAGRLDECTDGTQAPAVSRSASSIPALFSAFDLRRSAVILERAAAFNG